MKFCDINSDAQARELTGCIVYFPRKLAEEGTDDVSWAQIVGYSLIDDATDNVIGKIVAVDETTVNTLFEVSTPDGEEILIPASGELIVATDTEAQTVTMQIPAGLLDL